MTRSDSSRRCSSALRGFTLIELLVVIAIIGLLASLLFPVIGSALESGKASYCGSNLRQLGMATHTHLSDAGTYPVGLQGSSAADRVTWHSVLKALMTSGSSILSEQDSERLRGVFTCPSVDNPSEGSHHYSAHPVLMPHITSSGTYDLYDATRLGRPSKVVMIMDASLRPSVGYQADALAFNLATATTPYNSSDSDINDPIDPGPNMDADSSPARGNIRWRHKGDQLANFLFADGHVELLRPEQVFNHNVRAD